jgi:hypothetical protein
MPSTGRSTAPNIMPVEDPSISFRTDGIMKLMCLIIRNIRRSIAGENMAIDMTEIMVIGMTGGTAMGTAGDRVTGTIVNTVTNERRSTLK